MIAKTHIISIGVGALVVYCKTVSVVVPSVLRGFRQRAAWRVVSFVFIEGANGMDTVTVRFERLRHYQHRKKSYWLTAADEDELQLPVELTTLSTVETPYGLMVDAVTVPEWIAVDRGLVDCETRRDDEQREPQMSRQDWFTLGLTMAFLIRGNNPAEAEWEASKMAERFVNGRATE